MNSIFRLRDLGGTYGGLTGKTKADFGKGDASFVTFVEVINSTRLRGCQLEPVRVTKEERQNRVMRGDILFNGSSETPEEVAMSAVVDFDPHANTYLNSFCFGYRLRQHDELDPTYLAYFFRSSMGRGLVAALAQGATRYNIAKTKFLDLPLDLPSRECQLEIVEALTTVDDAIAALERMIVKKQAIKQGLMQELLTGKTRLPGFTKPWQQSELGELARIDPEALGAGTDPTEAIDYISLEDVERGELRGHSRLRFGNAPSRARRVVREMDVLFGTVRPNLQSHMLYRGGLRRPIASTGFAVIRPHNNTGDPQFLFHMLMSHLATTQIDRIIAGSNYPAVSGGDVRRLAFSVPDVDEQHAIGKALTDCDDELAVLKARLAKLRAVKQGMVQQFFTDRTRSAPEEDAT